VDDCLFFAETYEVIDEAVQQLRDAELDLNVEEDVAGFLGISMENQPSGSIKLTQKGLIDRTLTVLDLVPVSHTKKTPAEYGAIPKWKMVMNVQKHRIMLQFWGFRCTDFLIYTQILHLQ